MQMKIADIRDTAKAMGIKTGRINKAGLVRTIQSEEGNTSCFQTGVSVQCSQENCCWREDCLAEQGD